MEIVLTPYTPSFMISVQRASFMSATRVFTAMDAHEIPDTVLSHLGRQ